MRGGAEGERGEREVVARRGKGRGEKRISR